MLSLRGLREDGVFLNRIAPLELGLGGAATAPVILSVAKGPATFVIHPSTFRAQVRFYVDTPRKLGDVEITPIVGRVGRGGSLWEIRPAEDSDNMYTLELTSDSGRVFDGAFSVPERRDPASRITVYCLLK